MSLSKPKLLNPCKKFYEFKGDQGIFQTWDKENKKNIPLEIPFKFMVLDELSTIVGFCEAAKCGIFSNEVRSTIEEDLIVRTFKKSPFSAKGKYAAIKGDIKTMGGKYCRSVYAALIKSDGELELVNFRLTGASFSEWANIDFDKTLFAVSATGTKDVKKGKVEYKVPLFEPVEIHQDVLNKAIKMDESLQVYFKAYLSEKPKDVEESEMAEEDEVF